MPSSVTADTDLMRALELALAESQPFGDADYIWARVGLHYRHRLEILAQPNASVRELLEALDAATTEQTRRILGDPALRIAVDAAVAHVEMGAPRFPEHELASVVRRATANLASAGTSPPLAEGSARTRRVSDAPWPWVWAEDRVPEDPVGDLFRRVFEERDGGLVLTTPDAETLATLKAGVNLLHVLCPDLSRSALSHVHLIAVVSAGPGAGLTSLTDPLVPGTIFLSPSVLSNPWRAAEYILHEALHVKFVDLEHTHSLLSAGDDAESAPTLRPRWNRPAPDNANEWPIQRALTVFQVYTHLALFFSMVERRRQDLQETFGPLHGLDASREARRSLDRAHYLSHELRRREAHLGAAGRLFTRWLTDASRLLDDAPPPDGAYVHLYLDLYERECDELRGVVTRVTHDEGMWSRRIREAGLREVRDSRRALEMLGEIAAEHRELRRRADVLLMLDGSEGSLADTVEAFVAVRRSVAASLRGVTPTAFLTGDPETGAQTVIRDMVETSGQSLGQLLDGRIGKAAQIESTDQLERELAPRPQ
jgi:hypothetical protein